MITQLTLFDYSALDSETRIVVQQRTTEIKALMKRAASDIIEIGQKLIEVKERLEHGQFSPWLEAEFGWKHTTAWNFMQVADKFSKFESLDGFAPSALYLLAAPSTPESARQEAIARAEEGEVITHGLARGIVHDHKAPAEPYQPRNYDLNGDNWLNERETEVRESEDLYIEDRREAQRRQQIALITGSSESNEWYTPAHIIALAREVLGDIDLDPATSEAANKIVNAPSYCTITEDGFNQPWFGRVWLNPPYGTTGEGAAGWARKLITEYEIGQVEAAILLVKAALGYNWFEELWRKYPTCTLRERLSFVPGGDQEPGQAKHATALIYFGTDVERFRHVFRPYGRVILPETE